MYHQNRNTECFFTVMESSSAVLCSVNPAGQSREVVLVQIVLLDKYVNYMLL